MSATNRINYKIIIPALLLIVTILFSAGCGPSVKPAKEYAGDVCFPSNLQVQPGDHKVSLRWNTNCDDSTLLTGYYIYLTKEPIPEKILTQPPPETLEPFNNSAYPGDTDPETAYETMTIDNLDNGVEYYISVRTVYPDYTQSVSSEQISFIPRPEGSFTLGIRYSDFKDGFSFSMGEHVEADRLENDLYYYAKDGFDYLASPHRLNGFLRETNFYSLGSTESIYDYDSLELDYEPVSRIPVAEGHSYLVETEDNRYAKIRIKNIAGSGDKRKLSISYIYQPAENTMVF